MAGDIDYMLRVAVPNMQAYDAFYKRLIDTMPLKNVTSRFAMERIKSTTRAEVPFRRPELVADGGGQPRPRRGPDPGVREVPQAPAAGPGLLGGELRRDRPPHPVPDQLLHEIGQQQLRPLPAGLSPRLLLLSLGLSLVGLSLVGPDSGLPPGHSPAYPRTLSGPPGPFPAHLGVGFSRPTPATSRPTPSPPSSGSAA